MTSGELQSLAGTPGVETAVLDALDKSAIAALAAYREAKKAA
jgi:hypothetical protein